MTEPVEVGVTIRADVDETPRYRRAFLGQTIRLRAAFYDRATGAAVAVTAPTIMVRPPGSAIVFEYAEADLTADGLGVWELDVAGDTAGIWAVRVSCSLPMPAAWEALFTIAVSHVLPSAEPSTLLVTDDLAPLVTNEGGVLSAQRINHLLDAGALDGTERLLVTRGATSLSTTTDQVGQLVAIPAQEAAAEAAASAGAAAGSAAAASTAAGTATGASIAALAAQAAAAGSAEDAASSVALIGTAETIITAAAAADASASGAAGSATAAAGSASAAAASASTATGAASTATGARDAAAGSATSAAGSAAGAATSANGASGSAVAAAGSATAAAGSAAAAAGSATAAAGSATSATGSAAGAATSATAAAGSATAAAGSAAAADTSRLQAADYAQLALTGSADSDLSGEDDEAILGEDDEAILGQAGLGLTVDELDAYVQQAIGARDSIRADIVLVKQTRTTAAAAIGVTTANAATASAAALSATQAISTTTANALAAASSASAASGSAASIAAAASEADADRIAAEAARDAAIAAASAAAGSGGAPADAIVATVADYGIVIDGRRGTFYASWSLTGSALTIAGISATYTIDAGTAILRRTASVSGQGWAFQTTDVGQPIYCPGVTFSNGTSVSRIKRYRTPTQVELDHTCAAGFSGAMAPVWPCFETSALNKKIWIDGASTIRAGTVAPSHASNIGPLLTTISAVTSPVTVNIATTFSKIGQTTPLPTEICWGTDNSAGILAASAAAELTGQRVMLFKGNGLLTAFGLQLPWASRPGPTPGAGYGMGHMIWVGEGVRGFLTSTDGLRIYKQIIPRTAPPPRPAICGIYARKHLKRVHAVTGSTVYVVVIGDSMARDILTGWAPATQGPPRYMIEALRRALPGKRVVVVNRGIGGYTWDTVDDVLTASQPWGAIGDVYLDKCKLIPDGAGGMVVPDLVLVWNGGSNDNFTIRPARMLSVLNKIKTWGNDAFGNPPDVILENCRGGALSQDVTGNAGYTYGESAPYWTRPLQGKEMTACFNRHVAETEGYGVIDYYSRGQDVLVGWSPRHSHTRARPQIGDVTLNPTGFRFPYLVRDFSVAMDLWNATKTSNGTAAWAALGRIAVQMSRRQDNLLLIEPDATGRMTVEARTFGVELTTTVSMTSGLTGISVAAPVTVNAAWSMAGRADEDGMLQRCILNGGGTVAGIGPGSPILFPLADNLDTDLRTTIADGDVDHGYAVNDYVNENRSGATFYHSGLMFQDADARAKLDLIIDLPDGSKFATKIASVSDWQNAVMANAAPQTLTNASCRVFLGRVCVPRQTVDAVVTPDTGTAPELWIDLHDGHLCVSYAPGSNNTAQTVLRTSVERMGGVFRPHFTAAGSGIAVMSRVYVYEPDFVMPTLTSVEMWGFTGDTNESFGGDGGGHATTLQTAQVDQMLANAQVWG